MSKKEHVQYILKHESGFYVKRASGTLNLTEDISDAMRFEPNDKATQSIWETLYKDDRYSVIKRTETTEITYEGVKTVE